MLQFFRRFKITKGIQIALLIQEILRFCWMGGFCLLMELQRWRVFDQWGHSIWVLYYRVSMKAPLVMLKLLPPIFLFHLVQSFRFFFVKNFLTFFSRSGNFLTVMWFLIAQIKRFGTLNATQKTAALYEAPFLKTQEKLPEFGHF